MKILWPQFDHPKRRSKWTYNGNGPTASKFDRRAWIQSDSNLNMFIQMRPSTAVLPVPPSGSDRCPPPAGAPCWQDEPRLAGFGEVQVVGVARRPTMLPTLLLDHGGETATARKVD